MRPRAKNAQPISITFCYHNSNVIVIYNTLKCQDIIKNDCEVYYKMSKEPLIIKRRGEDGNKIISVRIREDTLAQLDRIANETNYSRNELINIILEHGVHNLEIQ